ncbi:unnamed protein product [Pleuronectes platessa]|uniref:Uncharacterized protein n=1 Tax=Pleuronectes platessa TaxID=8262 RepID=A0A9N7UIG3_PLEPL|nr:unnamed protein product [Pleuronectes platessa]
MGASATQGRPLMRPLQRPIDERPSVRDDDPSQEHPELGISCPGLSRHTKTSTVDRDLKGHRRKRGRKERGNIPFKQLGECEIETCKKKKMKQRHDRITYYSLPPPPLLCILAGTVRLTHRQLSVPWIITQIGSRDSIGTGHHEDRVKPFEGTPHSFLEPFGALIRIQKVFGAKFSGDIVYLSDLDFGKLHWMENERRLWTY